MGVGGQQRKVASGAKEDPNPKHQTQGSKQAWDAGAAGLTARRSPLRNSEIDMIVDAEWRDRSRIGSLSPETPVKIDAQLLSVPGHVLEMRGGYNLQVMKWI